MLKEFNGWRGKPIFLLSRYNTMNAINPINAIDARNSIIPILQAHSLLQHESHWNVSRRLSLTPPLPLPIQRLDDSIDTTNTMNAINPKNSRFSLTLALTLALTLTWILSLRPVRLRIGDYYYNQGKFEFAANEHQKLATQDRLRVDQDKVDDSKNTECFGILNSSFLLLLLKVKT